MIVIDDYAKDCGEELLPDALPSIHESLTILSGGGG